MTRAKKPIDDQIIHSNFEDLVNATDRIATELGPVKLEVFKRDASHLNASLSNMTGNWLWSARFFMGELLMSDVGTPEVEAVALAALRSNPNGIRNTSIILGEDGYAEILSQDYIQPDNVGPTSTTIPLQAAA